MDIVIGSGPSGIACAHSLLEKRRKVLILDFGSDLDVYTQRIVDRMLRVSHDQWRQEEITHIKKDYINSGDTISDKLVYGSDYPYKGWEKYFDLRQNDVAVKPSFAFGGFSSVWGSAILPVNEHDIKDWPFSVKELHEHYTKVLKFVPTSMTIDALSDRYPTYSEAEQSLFSSQQTESLLTRLGNNSEKLRNEGFLFGKSRLATNTQKNNFGYGCCYCGMCLYGCPYNLIFSTKYLLQDMLNRFQNLSYQQNLFVDKVEEKQGKVIVYVIDRSTNESSKIIGDRVFIGAGALSTSAILLKSLDEYDIELSMKDCQYFLFPFITYSSVGSVTSEKLHTLSQLFIELVDEKISKETVHLQVYTYNDLFLNRLRKMAGVFLPFIKNPVLGRLILFQGFLHSENSHTISLELKKNQGSQKDLLLLNKRENPRTSLTIKKIMKKLLSNRSLLGGVPIEISLDITKPGRSYHTGATFPMVDNPTKFQSDVMGRPYGYSKVFIIDSSNFPSIPATTITLTVMANAHRIGALSV